MDELEIKELLIENMKIISEAIRYDNPGAIDQAILFLKEETQEIINRREEIASKRSGAKIKELRSMSGMGLFSCKHALEKAEWDVDRAYDILKRGTQA